MAENIPVGAEYDMTAPFNSPVKEVYNATVCQSLSKSMSLDVANSTNLTESYEQWHYTPFDHIKILRDSVKAMNKSGIVLRSPELDKTLIKECEGWIVDETIVVED